jgi:hypothetical protein
MESRPHALKHKWLVVVVVVVVVVVHREAICHEM